MTQLIEIYYERPDGTLLWKAYWHEASPEPFPTERIVGEYRITYSRGGRVIRVTEVDDRGHRWTDGVPHDPTDQPRPTA